MKYAAQLLIILTLGYSLVSDAEPTTYITKEYYMYVDVEFKQVHLRQSEREREGKYTVFARGVCYSDGRYDLYLNDDVKNFSSKYLSTFGHAYMVDEILRELAYICKVTHIKIQEKLHVKPIVQRDAVRKSRPTWSH